VAALNTAESATELAGLVLLAPPVAERFEVDNDEPERCDSISPVHPRIRSSFAAVTRAKTPVLIVYGVHDEGFRSFSAAMEGELGDLLGNAGERVSVSLTEERIHGYVTVSGQETSVHMVLDWLERTGT
jgi:hypothetical protein